jgi:hypothetical protein
MEAGSWKMEKGKRKKEKGKRKSLAPPPRRPIR